MTRSALVFAALVGLSVSPHIGRADEKTEAKVEMPLLEHGSGTVIFNSDGGQKRLLYPGERLPAVGTVFVAGSTSATFTVKGVRFVLLPGSHGRLGGASGDTKRREDGTEVVYHNDSLISNGSIENNSDAHAAFAFGYGGILHPHSALHGRRADHKDKKGKWAFLITKGTFSSINEKDRHAGDSDGDAEVVAQLKADLAKGTVGPRKSQGPGQLVIDAQSESPIRLNIARYHVNVILQPPVALVQIDQGFFNPYPRQEEGTFVFNLPRGASVSRFAMYVTPTSLIEGEVVERQRAREVYDTIVRSRRDPAILEEIGDNLFKMRVFPIFPQETKRILLDYTVPLEERDGQYHFALPLLSDLKPIADFKITGSVRGDVVADSVACPTHDELKFKKADKSVDFSFSRSNYQPPADLQIAFREPPLTEPRLIKTLVKPIKPAAESDNPFEKERPQSDTEVLLARFPAAKLPEKSEPPADVLLLVDTSENMGDLAQSRSLVRSIVNNLRDNDRFRIAAIDHNTRWLSDGWASRRDSKAILDKLDREFALGGSNFYETVDDAVRVLRKRDDERRQIVVYLGDGHTKSGSAALGAHEELASRLRILNVPMFTTLVGSANQAGRQRCESLARETGGYVWHLDDSAATERKFFQWLIGGMPSPRQVLHVAIKGVDADDIFYPASLLPGEPLMILARGTPQAEHLITIRDSLSKESETYILRAKESDDTIFLGRQWAKHKLDRLRQVETDTGISDLAVVQKQVVALSQEWSVLSPRTAFLVLETEQDYVRWKIDRRVRRRYWKPAAEEQIAASQKWIDSLTASSGRESDLAETIEKSQHALKHGNPQQAESLLLQYIRRRGISLDERFQKLLTDSRNAITWRNLQPALGAHRALFDPEALHARPGNVAAPFLLSGLASPEFVKRHPHALQLLKPAPFKPGEWQAYDLLKEVRKTTGIRSIMTRDLESAMRESPLGFTVVGPQKVSIRTYLRELVGSTVKNDRSLDHPRVDEIQDFSELPHGLAFSTAEPKQRTSFLPVGDLFLEGVFPDTSRLANPYLDYDAVHRTRILAKLGKPISVDFVDVPTIEALQEIAEKIDEPILIHGPHWIRKHRDINKVTLEMQDVPAREALAAICSQLSMVHEVQSDVIALRSSEASQQSTRLHSLVGIIYEHPSDGPQFVSGFGGLGGFGSGFVGGFGGLGGGSATQRPFVTSVIPVVPSGDGTTGSMGLSDASAPTASGDAKPATQVRPESPTGVAAGGSAGSGAVAPEATAASGKFRWVPDFDAVISGITNHVQPSSWDEVGGINSVKGFDATLDLVVSADEAVHAELAEYLDSLRKISPSKSFLPGGRLAKPKGLSLTEAAGDVDSLIAIVTSTIQPTRWSEVGGTATISGDADRLALILTADDGMAEEVDQLLLQLRRRRWTQRHGTQPWLTMSGLAWQGWQQGPPVETFLSERTPDPAEAELKLLGSRRPQAGGVTYRRIVGGVTETVSVARIGERTQAELSGQRLRIEGDRAAIAYPGLAMFDEGPWGQALARELDARLPWLPHRTNRELAALFDVRPVANDAKVADDAKAADKAGGATRVRLHVPQSNRKQDLLIEMHFSPQGLPTFWQARRAGETVATLRFDKQVTTGGITAWQTVRMVAGENEIARWELQGTTATPADAALTAWPGLVALHSVGGDKSGVAKVVAAMQAMNYGEAVAALRPMLKAQPNQPLLQWLLALCHARDAKTVSREEASRALAAIVASSAADLRGAITAQSFSSFSPDEIYHLLAAQPVAKRSAADWTHLARSALAAESGAAAVEAAEAVLKTEQTAGKPTRGTRLLVAEALLLADKHARAAGIARQLIAEEPTNDDIETLVEKFAAAEHTELAAELWQWASTKPGISVDRRRELMQRRANVLTGLPRWRQMVEIYRELPAGSTEASEYATQIVRDVINPADAEALAKLAAEVKDVPLRRQLLLRVADLTLEPEVSADASWRAFQLGARDLHIGTAARQLLDADRLPDAIEMLETVLREGEPIDRDTRLTLVAAYQQAGFKADAARASTRD